MFPFALIFGAIGAVASVAGSLISANASNAAAKASQQENDLREQQMELETERQQRQTYRQILSARSNSLMAASSQGAQFGSGFQGGQSQIVDQGADTSLGITQAQHISEGIFKQANIQAQDESMVSWGQGLSSLGQTIGGLRLGNY